MKIKVEVLKKDQFYPNGYSVDIEGTDVPKKGVPVTENFNHYEVIGVAELDFNEDHTAIVAEIEFREGYEFTNDSDFSIGESCYLTNIKTKNCKRVDESRISAVTLFKGTDS